MAASMSAEIPDLDMNSFCREMSDPHKAILKKNRKVIIRHITPEIVLDYLIQDGIVNDEQKGDIMAPGTREARVRILLDILPSRSDKAFYCFIAAVHQEWAITFVGLTPDDLEISKKFYVETEPYVAAIKTVANIIEVEEGVGGNNEQKNILSQEIEDEMTQTILDGVKRVRELVNEGLDSPEREQECNALLKVINIFSKYSQRKIRHSLNGSVIFVVACNTLFAAEELKILCEQGILQSMLEDMCKQMKITERHGVKAMTLNVTYLGDDVSHKRLKRLEEETMTSKVDRMTTATGDLSLKSAQSSTGSDDDTLAMGTIQHFNLGPVHPPKYDIQGRERHKLQVAFSEITRVISRMNFSQESMEVLNFNMQQQIFKGHVADVENYPLLEMHYIGQEGSYNPDHEGIEIPINKEHLIQDDDRIDEHYFDVDAVSMTKASSSSSEMSTSITTSPSSESMHTRMRQYDTTEDYNLPAVLDNSQRVSTRPKSTLQESVHMRMTEKKEMIKSFTLENEVSSLSQELLSVLELLDIDNGTQKCWKHIAEEHNVEVDKIDIITHRTQKASESSFRQMLKLPEFYEYKIERLCIDLHLIQRVDIIKRLKKKGLECVDCE